MRHVAEGVIGQHADAVVAQVTRESETEGSHLLLLHATGVIPNFYTFHPSIHPCTRASKCSFYSISIQSFKQLFIICPSTHSFIQSFRSMSIPHSFDQQNITHKIIIFSDSITFFPLINFSLPLCPPSCLAFI